MSERPHNESSYERASPYAKAAFLVARDENALDHWHSILRKFSRFIEEKDTIEIITSPHVSKKDLRDLMVEMARENKATAKQTNFILVLAQDGQLALMPLIFDQFSAMKSAIDNKYDVTLTTARAFTPEEKSNLKKYLRERFNIFATIHEQCVPSIGEGFRVSFGETVIDQTASRQRSLKNKRGL